MELARVNTLLRLDCETEIVSMCDERTNNLYLCPACLPAGRRKLALVAQRRAGGFSATRYDYC